MKGSLQERSSILPELSQRKMTGNTRVIGIMEKKMETTIIGSIGILVYIGPIYGVLPEFLPNPKLQRRRRELDVRPVTACLLGPLRHAAGAGTKSVRGTGWAD